MSEKDEAQSSHSQWPTIKYNVKPGELKVEHFDLSVRSKNHRGYRMHFHLKIKPIQSALQELCKTIQLVRTISFRGLVKLERCLNSHHDFWIKHDKQCVLSTVTRFWVMQFSCVSNGFILSYGGRRLDKTVYINISLQMYSMAWVYWIPCSVLAIVMAALDVKIKTCLSLWHIFSKMMKVQQKIDPTEFQTDVGFLLDFSSRLTSQILVYINLTSKIF